MRGLIRPTLLKMSLQRVLTAKIASHISVVCLKVWLHGSIPTAIRKYGCFASAVLICPHGSDAVRLDHEKNLFNQQKHGVSFGDAQFAFADPRRVIAEDVSHGGSEKRYYCFGRVGEGMLTVRFTYRGYVIRIFGAGYWRKGKAIYERENKVHR